MATIATIPDSVQRYAKQYYKADPRGHDSYESYFKALADPKSSAPLPIELDTSHPISHYFIASSHNTYLSGNQLWSESTADSYKNVLKRECRCIEIDIWDGDSPSSSEAEDQASREQGRDLDVAKLTGMIRKGIGRLRSRSNADRKNAQQDTTDSPADDMLMPTPWRTQSSDEPVVYHGYTATAEMPFRDVCEVVRKYAFKASDLPIIISLEVHCSHAQQERVAELMGQYFREYLYPLPDDFCDSTPLPLLESLRKKILIKVKYVAPEKAKTMESTKDEESADDDPPTAVKKGKIVPNLSAMGIFTRAFHFHDFDQPEAKIPTHVFSLSEGKLLALCEEQPDKLLKHNLHHLMRAYPKGSRLRSSNLDPAPFWRFGLQMVALNYQKLNAAMMLNTAQFEGTGGWVLKPKGYLPVDGAQPPPVSERVTFNLKIKLLAGQDLGRDGDTPDVYVKCELHVESKAEAESNQIPNGGKAKGGEWKRRSAMRHSRDPDFGGEVLAFEQVRHISPQMSFLRIKVMDDALAQKDRLVGWACYRLDRLPLGLLYLRLRGDDYTHSNGKILLDLQLATSSDAASLKSV